MTKMALIEWLLFLLMIAKTEGERPINYSVGEEIMKTILKKCYGENSSPNSVVIFEDFNEVIDGVSTIQVNEFLDVKDYEEHGSLKFKASSVVLRSERPEKLSSHLQLLRRTKLWDNLIPFFIIDWNAASCTNSRIFLSAMWRMEILNSIYICPNSINKTPEIYTLNPITNYAPYPWTRVAEIDDMDVFRQNFDANISCTHLTYDKTKVLNGYDIVAVDWRLSGHTWVAGQNYFEEYARYTSSSSMALRTIIMALNASGKIEVEIGIQSIKRSLEGSADILCNTFTLDSFPDHPYLFPLESTKLVAVVKLKAEVSTLEKIRHLWSTSVLMVAAFALAVLFLILMIKRCSFGLALLDLTRFLTYVSIQTDNRYQSFRIYFSTMLIFIVISNGVFQGKIAAFLTTREKGSAAESVDELSKSGYQMYTTTALLKYARYSCPRCDFKEVSSLNVCVELVLNNTINACIMLNEDYESKFILLPLDRVRKPLASSLGNFNCRKHWPLRGRFNDMMMRVVESGLPDFWNMKRTRIPKAKRQSMEAEWSSAQYRPVALMKLDFAFKLLAAGLSLATIVFFLELCWARYVNP